jgi:hypothetical protein
VVGARSALAERYDLHGAGLKSAGTTIDEPPITISTADLY